MADLTNEIKAKGLEHAKNCQMGGSGAKPAFYGLANKIVLSKVKAALGLSKCPRQRAPQPRSRKCASIRRNYI